jgi:fermentation-respiration switch protein FrsA (DUF1100 family)
MKLRVYLVLASLLAAWFVLVPYASADTVQTYEGTLPSGATWIAQAPANWNGTLLLYSHGYIQPGGDNPARNAPTPNTANFLLNEGYALAGASYAGTGWAVEEAIDDQFSLLDLFDQGKIDPSIDPPTATVAWGESLGGMVTAGLVQEAPERFDGALPMCGVLGGGPGIWNQALDTAFAFKTLLPLPSPQDTSPPLDTSPLQLVNITDPNGNLQRATQLLQEAQGTPQGRARIALAAAVGDVPGWNDPTELEPAPNDFAAQEQNQFEALQQQDFPFMFAFRAELEARIRVDLREQGFEEPVSANPSSNVGVDYAHQLRQSGRQDQVEALYAEAGLHLDAELETLNDADRISADEGAAEYLFEYITYDGGLGNVPVLTMHTTADTLVVAEHEQAYADVVERAGDKELLEQIFVRRAGHCRFTPAEYITALQTLFEGMDRSWDGIDVSSEKLNEDADALGAELNSLPVEGDDPPTGPAFARFKPGQFLRPCDRLFCSERDDVGTRTWGRSRAA